MGCAVCAGDVVEARFGACRRSRYAAGGFGFGGEEDRQAGRGQEGEGRDLEDYPLKMLHWPAGGVLLGTEFTLENGWRLSWGTGERTAHVCANSSKKRSSRQQKGEKGAQQKIGCKQRCGGPATLGPSLVSDGVSCLGRIALYIAAL